MSDYILKTIGMKPFYLLILAPPGHLPFGIPPAVPFN